MPQKEKLNESDQVVEHAFTACNDVGYRPPNLTYFARTEEIAELKDGSQRRWSRRVG